MYTEARKIHIIEEVLKVTDDATLTRLETVFKTTKKTKAKRKSVYDFMGILSKKEAVQMRKAMQEPCETIHADDWK